MTENRIFGVENDKRGERIVIDLERVCAIKITDVNTVKIIFDSKSFDWYLTTNTIDKLLQQFIEYKTGCPCTPPSKNHCQHREWK